MSYIICDRNAVEERELEVVSVVVVSCFMSRHLIHQPLHGETRTFAETQDIAVSKLVGRGWGDVRNFAGRKRVLDAE